MLVHHRRQETIVILFIAFLDRFGGQGRCASPPRFRGSNSGRPESLYLHRPAAVLPSIMCGDNETEAASLQSETM